jgi:O2-independent ubiquinone biosynthesis protein UbiU
MSKLEKINKKIELVCPAGSAPALVAAVDNGADCVYIGFRGMTNARNFAGLNFEHTHAWENIGYAHLNGVKVFVALNTYPQAANWASWTQAVDRCAELGVDAVILADLGLMQYAAKTHPQLRLHLSVQASASNYEAINFYYEHFGIKRAVLPRVLTLAQVEAVIQNTQVEIELFGFGGLCVMVEGRCALSSYVSGEAPNMSGACSPGLHVRWGKTPKGLETRLNEVLVNRFGDDEQAGYPTLCKGRFAVEDETYYAFEEPASLNTMELLPQMRAMGVSAIKIEGRQRSAAYVAQVTRTWRAAIDACMRDTQGYVVKAEWLAMMSNVAEGSQHTLGAYHRPWK